MAITVRELVTKLGFVVDDKKLAVFDRRVAALKKSLGLLIKTTAVVGGAITAIAVRTANAGDELAKTSRRLGLNVEALQEWRFAATRAGVDIRTFDMAVQRFGRRVAEAARGQGEARDALAEMGIELTDVNGKLRDSDVLLTESLIALSKQENEFRRNALAMKLFDSEGVRLVQLAAEGAEGIETLRKEFRALGAGITEEGTKAGEAFIDAWTDLKAVLNGVVFAIGEELLPLFTEIFKAVTKWIADNRKLAIVLAKVAGAIGLITVVATGAVAVITALGVAWVFLNSQIAFIPFVIAVAVVALLALVATLVLIAEDIIAFTKGKDSVFGRFIQGLQTLGAILKENLIRMFREAWMTIQNETIAIWTDIVNRLTAIWDNFVATRLDPILQRLESIRGLLRFTPSGLLGEQAARLIAPRGEASGGSTSMNVNVNVTPPAGTSVVGVGQAVVSAFKASLNQLTMGRTGLGR